MKQLWFQQIVLPSTTTQDVRKNTRDEQKQVTGFMWTHAALSWQTGQISRNRKVRREYPPMTWWDLQYQNNWMKPGLWDVIDRTVTRFFISTEKKPLELFSIFWENNFDSMCVFVCVVVLGGLCHTWALIHHYTQRRTAGNGKVLFKEFDNYYDS